MKTSEILIELSSNGYCERSKFLMFYFQWHPDIRSNFFRFSSGVAGKGGGFRYSSWKLFGKILTYYVLDCEEAKKEFSEHLVEIFLEKNPNPDKNIRRSFTHLLHQYNLHWDFCYEKVYNTVAATSPNKVFS